jgi:6-phosphogluconolactonase (cycloisomerase 2 family)
VACSKDGKHVYVNAGRFGGDQALSVFAVAPGGKLQLVEEHIDGEGSLEDYKGGNDIGVSPDGRLVFALTTLSDRLFRFQRDPDKGSLIFIGSQPVGEKELPGSAGLCFSPDGKYVYVADEAASSIVVFKVP